MFSPQVGRTYYTEPPTTLISAMNRQKGAYTRGGTGGKVQSVDNTTEKEIQKQLQKRFNTDLKASDRFPNHLRNSNTNGQNIEDRRISWAAQSTT
jgi:hypothetical protein